MMINKLKNIIGKKVKRLFLIVWPPLGESDAAHIDISAGFVFEDLPQELFKISTDRNELTSPIVESLHVPDKYIEWREFEKRMNSWMNYEEEMEINTEFYDVSEAGIFQNILNQKVLDVELVSIANDCSLGVKLIFEHDFILSTPINDGNTIETSFFNKTGNLKNFESLGRIDYTSLKPADKK